MSVKELLKKMLGRNREQEIESTINYKNATRNIKNNKENFSEIADNREDIDMKR